MSLLSLDVLWVSFIKKKKKKKKENYFAASKYQESAKKA